MYKLLFASVLILFGMGAIAQENISYDPERIKEIRQGCDCSIIDDKGDVEYYGLVRAYKNQDNGYAEKKYGWLSYKTGKPVIPFVYDKAQNFDGATKTAIVTNFVNDKKVSGTINASGEIILPIKYKGLRHLRDRYYYYYEDKCFIINESGEMISKFVDGVSTTYDVNKVNGAAPYFIFSKAGKDGLINENGVEVVPAVFEDNDVFMKYKREHDIICGTTKYGEKRYYKIGKGWLNEHIYQHAKPFDSNGEAKFQRDGISGYLTTDGEEHTTSVNKKAVVEALLKKTYDSYEEEVNGYTRVKKGIYYGFVDNTGKLVVPTEYYRTFQFVKGHKIVGVEKGGKQGYVTASNEVFIPLIHQRIFMPKEDMIKVKKDGKFGYYNISGKLIYDYVFESATDFTGGLADAVQNGKAVVLDKQGNIKSLVNEAGSDKSNAIEIDFGHTYNMINPAVHKDKVVYAHFGIVWNKYTGENRIFYSRNLYDYDFKGKSNWKIKTSQLSEIWDTRGEIMFKAVPYFVKKWDDVKEYNRILAFNTYNGKAIMFQYNASKAEFVETSKDIKESPYKSPKGGKIMWGVSVVYEKGGEPSFTYYKWNTLTGKNSLKDLGDDFTIDPEVDGEFMIAFDSGVNDQSEYVLYTSKSFRTYRKSYGWENLKKKLSYSTLDANYTIHLALMKKASDDIYKATVKTAIIFDANSLNNDVGIFGNEHQTFEKYKSMNINKAGYEVLSKPGEEIGVCMFSNAEDVRIEYLFWNKTTGKFKIFSYSHHEKKFDDFKESLFVEDNLLKLPVGTAAKVTKGEAP